MIKIDNCNFFLLIDSKNVKFEAIDENDEIYFSKKNFLNDSQNIKNFNVVDQFLKMHFFDIEKKIDNYIKEINLVISSDDFIFVNASMKCTFDENEFNEKRLNILMSELKSQFKNTIGRYEIIHMVISRFLVNGNIYHNFNDIKNFDKIFLDIKFICFDKDSIKALRNILSKYEIVIKNIISLEYLKDFDEFNDNTNLLIARKALNGLNKNEIFFSNKGSKNMSFFEKFFSFFS